MGLFNLARMSTATVGTGTITLGAAVAPWLTFAQAGVTDGQTVSYAIQDGAANSEIGTGVYTASGTTLTRNVTNSTNSNSAISLSGAAQVYITARAEDIPYPSPPSGRLSASSGVAVTTTDQASVTTLYYVAIGQDHDPIYDGVTDVHRSIGTPSLTINSTNNVANTCYDVYEIWDSGVLKLAAGVAWTTNTAGSCARGTGAGTAEVTTFHGRRVNANSMTMKNGANTYTVAANQGNLIGGFRVTSVAGETEDSISKRLVWNEYNAVPRPLRVVESAVNWSYSTNSYHQANANSANTFSVFSGASGRPFSATACGSNASSTTTPRTTASGVGINSTTVNSATILIPATGDSSRVFASVAYYDDFLPLGYNEINWLEIGAGLDTQTWLGTGGLSYVQTGMNGRCIQ